MIIQTSTIMEFTSVFLIYFIGLAVAAPVIDNADGEEAGRISEDILSKIADYTHPKLQQFQEQSYTLDEVLDVLQQELETQHPKRTSLLKNERSKRYTCGFTTLYGGSGGAYFNDGCPKGIRMIDIYFQSHTVRGLKLRYVTDTAEYNSPLHGVASGTHYQVDLATGEEIVAVVGRYTSSRIQQLAFLTQSSNNYYRHTFGPYGNAQGDLFIENRGNIVAVYGRQGSDLDAVGFRYR